MCMNFLQVGAPNSVPGWNLEGPRGLAGAPYRPQTKGRTPQAAGNRIHRSSQDTDTPSMIEVSLCLFLDVEL